MRDNLKQNPFNRLTSLSRNHYSRIITKVRVKYLCFKGLLEILMCVKGYATPLMRLNFPASVSCRGLNFCLVGHDTSPAMLCDWSGQSRAYATPLMRLTFPASVSCRGLNFCLVGQENITSPPPPGTVPRLLTWSEWK